MNNKVKDIITRLRIMANHEISELSTLASYHKSLVKQAADSLSEQERELEAYRTGDLIEIEYWKKLNAKNN